MMREKLNDRLERYGYKDGMSIADFHRQLMEGRGCETCENRGDNGCGVAFIDGFEFFDPYDEDEDESVALNDDDCWRCGYRNREEDDRRELKELRSLVRRFNEQNVLSHNLKYFRKASGLTQEQAMEMTGISVPSLQRYENGRSEPKATGLLKLSCAYGVSIDRLCGLITEEQAELMDLHHFSTNSQRPQIIESARAAQTKD